MVENILKMVSCGSYYQRFFVEASITLCALHVSAQMVCVEKKVKSPENGNFPINGALKETST